MQTHIRNFLNDESGAAVVEWVVLAAATVGIGLGAAAAVRTATDTLSDNGTATLQGNQVATTCADGASYDQTVLSGISAEDAAALSDQYAQMSEDELLKNYAEIAEITADLYARGGSTDEAMDYAYMASQELNRRSIVLPSDVKTLNELSASVGGSAISSACGGGVSETTPIDVIPTVDTPVVLDVPTDDVVTDTDPNAYRYQVFSAEQARSLTEEYARYGPEELVKLAEEIYRRYEEAAANRDTQIMQEMIDYLYVAYQAAIANGRDPNVTAAAEEYFNKVFEDYSYYYR